MQPTHPGQPIERTTTHRKPPTNATSDNSNPQTKKKNEDEDERPTEQAQIIKATA